jgi:hypothetical protein
VIKKDIFNKITAFTSAKPPVETPTSHPPPPPQPLPQISHIHRHHRNTSTVSQNENILTTQPSTQSISLTSDQSYSSVNTEITTNNNGTTTTYHPSRRHPLPPPPIVPPISQPSESMNMELSPSVISNNNNNNNSLIYTPPSQMNMPQTPNNNQWRHKLNNLKQSFQSVGTPRFHRRAKVLCKLTLFQTNKHIFSGFFQVTESDSSTTSNSPSQYGTTPEATKKSLFHHIIDAMQEDHHMIVVKDRPLAAIKTDLIHAFLSVKKQTFLFSLNSLLYKRLLISYIMFYRVHNIDVNIDDQIVHQCFNVIYVFMWKFVQLNQLIHHHLIVIM